MDYGALLGPLTVIFDELAEEMAGAETNTYALLKVGDGERVVAVVHSHEYVVSIYGAQTLSAAALDELKAKGFQLDDEFPNHPQLRRRENDPGSAADALATAVRLAIRPPAQRLPVLQTDAIEATHARRLSAETGIQIESSAPDGSWGRRRRRIFAARSADRLDDATRRIRDADTPTSFIPGFNWSFDWCRFRRSSHCWYPTDLNVAASHEEGYAVVVTSHRGYCPFVKWESQQSCAVSEACSKRVVVDGTRHGSVDATYSWEEGGQRTYRVVQMWRAPTGRQWARVARGNWMGGGPEFAEAYGFRKTQWSRSRACI